MGGTQNFWSPSVSDGDEVEWTRGLAKKNPTEAKTAQFNAKLGLFCYFKHEIQLFKVLLSLKVVKFDTKMYSNFSNFQGWTSAGEEQALVQKRGQVSDGGDWQNFRQMGGPPVPLEKKTLPREINCIPFLGWMCCHHASLPVRQHQRSENIGRISTPNYLNV